MAQRPMPSQIPFRARPGAMPMQRPGQMQPGGRPQGMMPPKMMANGGDGLGSPDPIGGPPMPPPPPPKMAGPGAGPGAGPDPDNDGDMDSPTITPEAVQFHDELRTCGPVAGGAGCKYFNGGQCAVLKMQVPEEGACSAFSSNGDTDTGDTGLGGGGAPPDDGTSGPPLS